MKSNTMLRRLIALMISVIMATSFTTVPVVAASVPTEANETLPDDERILYAESELETESDPEAGVADEFGLAETHDESSNENGLGLGESPFVSEQLGNEHILVESFTPREQEVVIGDSVNIVDLAVSVADIADAVLLLRYEILHDGRIVGGSEFPMERVPQGTPSDFPSEPEITLPELPDSEQGEYPPDEDTNSEDEPEINPGDDLGDNGIVEPDDDAELDTEAPVEPGENEDDGISDEQEVNGAHNEYGVEPEDRTEPIEPEREEVGILSTGILFASAAPITAASLAFIGEPDVNYAGVNDSDASENFILANTFSVYNIIHTIEDAQLEDTGEYSVIIFYIVDGIERTLYVGPKSLDVSDVPVLDLMVPMTVGTGNPIVYFQGRYYQRFDIGLTWEDARAHAQSLGGDLAVIRNAAAQTFIEGLIGPAGGLPIAVCPIDGESIMRYWIGGYRVAQSGVNQFAWVTGEPMTFTNWDTVSDPANPEPNNRNGNERYIEIFTMTPGIFGMWNDAPNNAAYWNDPAHTPRPQIMGHIVEWSDAPSISVSTAAELRAALTLDIPNRVITLQNDINLGAWVPVNIPEASVAMGTFTLNGNGFILTMSAERNENYAGLFGRISSPGSITIRNLGIRIVGNGVRAVSGGTPANLWAGGIVGLLHQSTMLIEYSFVAGSIILADRGAANTSSWTYAGGFFGETREAAVTIRNSYVNVSDIWASSVQTNASGIVARSYSGGFIGRGSGDIVFENSYAAGIVAAWAWNTTGSLGERLPHSGGLIGHGTAMVFNSVRAQYNVSGGTPSLVGTLLTPFQLRDSSTHTIETWDWNDTWMYVEGVNAGFPVLRLFGFHEYPRIPLQGPTIRVSTAAEFRAALTESTLNRVIYLENDINLASWEPVHIPDTNAAMGTFIIEGNGFILSFNAVRSDNYAGLFGRIDGFGFITIRNLGLRLEGGGVRAISPGVPTELWAGGLVGLMHQGSMVIENSFVAGQLILAERNAASTSSRTHAGGFFGEVRGAVVAVRNSYVNVSDIWAASVQTNTSGIAARSHAGGFVGRELNGDILFQNSYATGTVGAWAWNATGSLGERLPHSGGLIGLGFAEVVNAVRGQYSVHGGEVNLVGAHLTPAQLRDSSTHTIDTWDWDDTWMYVEDTNANLPVLRVFGFHEYPRVPPTGPTIYVSTALQLRNALTESTINRVIVLQNDINLGTWIPVNIADTDIATGTFTLDGNGFTLAFTAERNVSYSGLFGRIDSPGHIVIKNLGIRLMGNGVRSISPGDPASVWAGGIVGLLHQGSIVIEESFVVGTTIIAQREAAGTSSQTFAGGFIGQTRNTAVTIRNSYVNVSEITADSIQTNTSGIIASAHAGGFVGGSLMGDIHIVNGYATGVVQSWAWNTTGSSGSRIPFSGGIIGYGYAEITNAARAQGIVSGGSVNPAGYNLTPAQLRDASSLPINTWDWDNIWIMAEGTNANFPILRVHHLPQFTPGPVIDVRTTAELRAALLLNDGGRIIRLQNNINLGSWVPINIATAAVGVGTFTLDGNGFEILFTAERNERYAGLFGRIDSPGHIVIRNLGVRLTGEGVRALSDGTPESVWAGGIAGMVHRGSMIIENSFVSGTAILAQRTGGATTTWAMAGGFIGEANNAVITIVNSHINVTNITANPSATGTNFIRARAGGMIGREWLASIRIENSYAQGAAVTASGTGTAANATRFSGGLIGEGSGENVNSVYTWESITGVTHNPIGTALTLAQLRDSASLPINLWDWETTWTYVEGENANLPVLRAFFAPVLIAPQIQTATLPGGMVGQAYSHTLIATGTTPITWTSDSLPTGLSLHPATGVISGTPTTAGTYTIIIRATNVVDYDERQYELIVAQQPTPPQIATEHLPNGAIGQPYNETLAATGTAPITWSIASGTLPDGLTLNANTGVISGAPTTAGTSNFTVRATNDAGNHERALSIVVAAGAVAPVITTTELPGATVGQAYSETLQATGTAPITWSIASGVLPAGLTLNPSTGVISGTPTTAGTANFTVRAANAEGHDDRALSIEVIAITVPPTIANITPPGGVVGQPYSVTFTATGTAPITWGIVSGELPAGLSLNTDTGVVSGTPIAAGTSNFTISATNAAGDDERAFSIVIAAEAAPPVITGYSAPNGMVGAAYNFQFVATGSPTPAWSHTGQLPPGVTLNSQGLLSGTPTQAGSFTFTVIAYNGVIPYATREVTVVIAEQPVISDTTLTIVRTFASPGEEVTVHVRLDGNPGFSGMAMRLSFSSYLTLASYGLGHPDWDPAIFADVLEDLCDGFEGPTPGDADSFFGWITRDSNIYLSGVLLTLTFTVAPNAPQGELLPISIVFANSTGDIEIPTNKDGEELDIRIVNGGVTIQSVLIGDANGDGRRTSADGTVLARYLAGHNVVIDKRAMDIDGNGYVDGRDLVMFARWLVGHLVPPTVQN